MTLFFFFYLQHRKIAALFGLYAVRFVSKKSHIISSVVYTVVVFVHRQFAFRHVSERVNGYDQISGGHGRRTEQWRRTFFVFKNANSSDSILLETWDGTKSGHFTRPVVVNPRLAVRRRRANSAAFIIFIVFKTQNRRFFCSTRIVHVWVCG